MDRGWCEPEEAGDVGLRGGKQCLARRIADIETLRSEVAAWEERRNGDGATIRWLFSVEKARKKMGRLYPCPGRKIEETSEEEPSTAAV